MIKKVLKVLAILVVAALVVIQFFVIDKTNPPVNAAETMESAITVPDNVRAVLDRSCADCHSHKTVYPWYSNFQPAAWFLKDHIDEGRQKINFSIFGTYTLKKRAHKLEEVCEQIEKKEMPLPSYLWIHGESALTADEGKLLCDWSKAEKAKIDAQIALEPPK
jgi:hypothetical protein